MIFFIHYTVKKTISLKKITCSKSFFSYWTDFCEPIIQEKTARTYDFFKLPWPLCFSVERLVLFSHFCMLFKYSCLQFPQITPPQPRHSPLPPIDPTPHWVFPCVLYTCFWKLFPLSPPLSHLNSPLVTVSLFFILMFLVILCLLGRFVD